MNTSDKKKKLRFNIIDWILILAVLLASVLLYGRIKGADIVKSSGKKVALTYTLSVSPLREEFRNLVSVGDHLTDQDGKAELGEVSGIAYSPCFFVGTDSVRGTEVKTLYTDRFVMTLTVTVTAKAADGIYTLDGKPLTVGEHIAFRSPNFTGEGICTDIFSPVGA